MELGLVRESFTLGGRQTKKFYIYTYIYLYIHVYNLKKENFCFAKDPEKLPSREEISCRLGIKNYRLHV